MAGLRGHLRHWAKFPFGSIKLRKLALLHELEILDLAEESRLLAAVKHKQEEDVLLKLKEIGKPEELYWKQRSRLQWLKEGDENTSIFHAVANGGKNRNFIPSINHQGASKTDPREIGKLFSDWFKQQF